jgi:DNA-binding transcriptional ArsR family regulator
VRDFYNEHRQMRPENIDIVLEIWADSAAFGENYLVGIREYYSVFFAEEEHRLSPLLEAGLEQARQLASQRPLLELLEHLSQGILFDNTLQCAKIVLAPSYWITPLVYIDQQPQSCLFLFGVRPPGASLIPGDWVPDALIHGLKALADPTRLRIIRLLSEQPLTLAELARQLRLRPPTVIHHLNALRLAGMVHLTLGNTEERRYTTRQEAFPALWKEIEVLLQLASDQPI